MNDATYRLAALTTAALVFSLSFAGGFYTQASLSDREAVGGSLGAAANFGGNTGSTTAGNTDGGAGNTEDCTGNDDCDASFAFVAPGSGPAAAPAHRVGG